MNNETKDFSTLYSSFLNRDSSLEGLVFVAVKTTGIFCRPTCTARKPNPENIEFLPTAREALLRGYRPCKICRPLNNPGEVPHWLELLIQKIHATPDVSLKDQDLIKQGIDPNRVRRWFKKTHGMTFQGYLRALRVGQAFGQIARGEGVTQAAFNSGYSSLSGFGDSFSRTTGFPPSQSPTQSLIISTRIITPVGPMLAGATDEGVCLLEFTDRRMVATQIKRLKVYLKAELIPGSHPTLDLLQKQIGEYFAGQRREFSLPLVTPGTAFQQRVWKCLLEIPYGTTRSYQDQAIALGVPQAVRAVAKANGDNRIAIIIPCHRVIGKDGALTGYGGGLERKKFLLEFEAGHSPESL